MHGPTDNPDVVDRVPTEGHRGGHTHQCEVPRVPVRHLLEIERGTCPCGRDPNRGQDFFWLEHRHPRDVGRGLHEEVLGLHDSLATRVPNDHHGVQRDQRRGWVRRGHRYTAIGTEDTVLSVHRSGRVCIANVAPRPVTREAVAIIPATRVLTDVATQRARVAYLRSRHLAHRVRKHAVPFFNQRVTLDLRERRHRADLNPVVRFSDPLEFGDTCEVDSRLDLLRPILERIQTVEPAGQWPTAVPQAVREIQRIVQTRGLKQLEMGHHVFEHESAPQAVFTCSGLWDCVFAEAALMIISVTTGVRLK